MIVLSPVRRLLRISGLWFESGQSALYRVYRIYFFCVLLMLLQPQIAYLYANIDNVIVASGVSITLVSEMMAIAKVFSYVYYRDELIGLLQRFQRDFDERERRGRCHHMRVADREVAIITRVFTWMMFTASVAFHGLPLLVLLFGYMHGTLGPMAEWPLPFSGVYAFDITCTPGYQFAYVLGIMFTINGALCSGCNDLLYLALCRYAAAYLDGWAEDLQAMDKEYCDKLRGRGYHRAFAAGRRLRQRMKEMILAHYHILQILDTIARTQAPVILSQFAFSIVMLSMLGFQATISDDASFLIYAISAFSILFQLFIYCYYGNMLTQKSLECVDKIWLSTHWYTYPLPLQRYVQLVMLRMQSPVVLSGFGYVDCTLDTFVATLKTIGSVIALLQNLEDV